MRLAGDVLVGETGWGWIVSVVSTLGLAVVFEEIILLSIGAIKNFSEFMILFYELDQKDSLRFDGRITMDDDPWNNQSEYTLAESLQNMGIVGLEAVMCILPSLR